MRSYFRKHREDSVSTPQRKILKQFDTSNPLVKYLTRIKLQVPTGRSKENQKLSGIPL